MRSSTLNSNILIFIIISSIKKSAKKGLILSRWASKSASTPPRGEAREPGSYY